MSSRLDPDFLALVSAHEEELLRAARLLTGDWDRAEKLLRDTLAWALAGWELLAEDAAAELRIQQRLIADFLSSHAGHGAEPPAPRSPGGRPPLVDALARLPPDDRAVVVCRYYLGLAPAEIGEILGIEAEEASAAAARALAVLQRRR